MNPLRFVFLLLFLPVSLYGQTSVFLKTYNKGNSGFAVREVNGNSYAVAGGTDFYYNFHWMNMSPVSNTNIHFFKTDVNGNRIWESVFSSLGKRSMATWMEPVAGTGFILTGHTNSEVSWPPDSNNIFLVKTDVNGLLQWAKYYDTGKDELGFCVRPCYDNGFILSGFHDAAPMSLMGTTYSLLVKTDSAGNVTWAKKYQIAVRDFDTGEAFPTVVRQTADSGFVVVGTTSGAHQADVYVFRTDISGNLLWARSYEHDNSAFRLSTGLDITETSSGEIVLAGSLDKDRLLNQNNYPFIMKLSGGGILLDSRLYDSNPVQMFQSGFSSVEEIPGDGFFFTGMGGYGGFGNQAELLKTDAGFNLQWSRVYTWDGLATMGARSARHTSDGGYIFAGKRQFAGTVVMKTDITGMVPCKNPGVLIPVTPSFNTVIRNPATLSGITAVLLPLTVQSPVMDTSIVCPVTVTTLPVELLSFTAEQQEGNKVSVNWVTASETNNDYFIIERSADGILFETAGKVYGAGTSTAVHSYRYTDQAPAGTPVLYYRLKQVDFDGAFRHSRFVQVRLQYSPFRLLRTEASPENRTIHLYFFDSNPGSFTYRLTDMLGRMVSEGSGTLVPGLNELSLKTGNLARGLYSFSLTNGGHRENGRIVY